MVSGETVDLWLLKNRMSELFTSGSVGGGAGNRPFYPATPLVGDWGYAGRKTGFEQTMELLEAA